MMIKRFGFLFLFLMAALPASAQSPIWWPTFYSSAFGGTMAEGYTPNPPAGTYSLKITPQSTQNNTSVILCEVTNVASVVALQASAVQPVGGNTSSLTTPSFSTTGQSTVAVFGTTTAGGFNASPGLIGGVSSTLVSSTNGNNINLEHAEFASAQTGITAAMGGLSGGSIIMPLALTTTGTPSYNCNQTGQSGSLPFTAVALNVTGGSGHALIFAYRNSATSAIPISVTDDAPVNGATINGLPAYGGNQWIVPMGPVYYISHAAGSDSNAGTTPSTAWADDPEMQSHPTHTPTAGDIYIYKGCDDWPNADFPLLVTHSGSSTAYITRWIDQSWFNTSTCPTYWLRPKWDAGGSAITGGVGECSQTNGIFYNAYMILSSSGSSYLNWGWLEWLAYHWNGCGTNTYESMLGGIGTKSYVDFSNIYIHDFTASYSSGGSMQSFYPSATPSTNSFTDRMVLDDSDTSPTNPNGGNIDWETTNSICDWADNCFRISTPGTYANNNITNVCCGPAGNHANTVESLLSGTVYLYNNFIHDMTAADTIIATGNPGETDYIWGNVVSNVNTTPMGIPQGSSSNSIYIWGNTMDATAGTCILLGGASDWTVEFWAQDNFCIGGAFLSPTPTGTPTIILGNNPLATVSQANSMGYAQANTYPWGPTSTNCNGIATNCPIAAGVNLTAQATGLISALQLDTTLGCTEVTVNGLVLSACASRPPCQRPGIGVTPQAWDAGAYQLCPALTVNAASTRFTVYKDALAGFLGGGEPLSTSVATTLKVANVRWGGDAASRYNFNNDVFCPGADQPVFICQALFGTNSPSYSPNLMVSTYRSAYASVHALITIPTITFISAPSISQVGSFPVSTYGAQTTTQTVGGVSVGNGCNTTPSINNVCSPSGTPIVDTNPTLNMVANSTTIEGNWLNSLISTFGSCGSAPATCVTAYQLDNEPGGWSNTHRDAQSCAIDYTNSTTCPSGGGTFSSLVTLDQTMSDLIYSKDSAALILGPSDFGPYGWINNCSSCTGGANPSYSGQMFLKQYQLHDTSVAHRTLGCFDEHFNIGNNDGVFADTFNFNRNFNDANYNGSSQFVGYPNAPMQVIPTFQSWVSTYYPGTPVCFSELEYSYTTNGGVDAAETADALGIFTYYGVRLADFYNVPGFPNSLPNDGFWQAFYLFNNANGAGERFGDTSVTATTGDLTTLSAYPAIRTADNHLTIVVINKSPSYTTSTLTVSGGTYNSSVAKYVYGEDNQVIAAGAATNTSGVITNSYPPYSETMLDLTPSGSTPTAPAPANPMLLDNLQPSKGRSGE
jgi:hypothetical protein